MWVKCEKSQYSAMKDLFCKRVIGGKQCAVFNAPGLLCGGLPHCPSLPPLRLTIALLLAFLSSVLPHPALSSLFGDWVQICASDCLFTWLYGHVSYLQGRI